MNKFLLTLLILSTFFCGSARGYSSPNVPLEDPAYEDVDKLIGAGLVKDVIYGQRPWSREEFARIIETADVNFDEEPSTTDEASLEFSFHIRGILNRLKVMFRDEILETCLQKTIQFHPLKRIETQLSFIDSESRPFLNFSLGSINANLQPIAAYQEGRHFPDGGQFALETEHSLIATRFLSFYARPRFQLDMKDGGNVSGEVFVQQLYGKFAVPHFELEVGRDTLAWGQTAVGGNLLTTNARPLDMIKISNPSPTVLPWIFKYLGPIKYSFFIANLGPEREFPYSYLTGAKISLKPFSFFELGLHQLVMMGGDGAPTVDFGHALSEFIGFRSGDIDTINLSNRQTGGDLRFYIPQLNQAQIYLDAVFEDDSSDRWFMLAHLTNYQAGLFFPLLTNRGELSLRLEYHHGSPYFYKHGLFSDGMTLNQKILGDNLGPQGHAFYIDLGYDPSENWRLHFVFEFENRSGDLVTEVKDPHRRVVTLSDEPDENRYTGRIISSYYFRPHIRLLTHLAYQNIHDYAFVSGDDRSAFFGQVRFQYDF